MITKCRGGALKQFSGCSCNEMSPEALKKGRKAVRFVGAVGTNANVWHHAMVIRGQVGVRVTSNTPAAQQMRTVSQG